MTKLNVIGVDLAKNVIQVSVLSPLNRELRNSALTRRKFAEFLTRQRPSLVAFEACATSHYWARVAQRHGHEVKIIPAKAVFPFRQGYKTDENDTLAVAEAANRQQTVWIGSLVRLRAGAFDALVHEITDHRWNGGDALGRWLHRHPRPRATWFRLVGPSHTRLGRCDWQYGACRLGGSH